MTEVVDLEKARLGAAVKRGFRNWKSQFRENFGTNSTFSNLSRDTLTYLAQGKDKSTFYLFDLIMSLLNLGSGFEFNEINSKNKMAVMDRHLFLLDRIRFEYMKRLGWLEGFPGQEFSLVDLVLRYDTLSPGLQSTPVLLSRRHPAFEIYRKMTPFEKEEFIRKLIPKALKTIENHSTTL
ncbi:MAG: hypothetical protein ABII06_08770 [Pseudomonadota bacterium]